MARTHAYPLYRVAHYVNGTLILRSFTSYALAREAANLRVRELTNGSPVSGLSADHTRDAIAALERMDGYFKSTENRVSLDATVGEFVGAASKLKGVTLAATVEGNINNVVVVSRKGLGEAVAEFVAERKN